MMGQPKKLDVAAIEVLYKVYRAYVIDGYDDAIPFDDVPLDFRPKGVTSFIMKLALEALRDEGRLKATRNDRDEMFYELSLDGLRYVESQLDQVDTLVAQCHARAELQLSDSASRDVIQVPAADRIVTLDHNAPPTREALEQLDRLIEAVRSDNEFAGDPDEKSRVVAELSASRKLLEAVKVRARGVYQLVVPALAWVRDNIAKVAATELAKKLGEWLAKVLL